MTAINEEIENKYDLNQCKKIQAEENKFLDKSSKECAKNSATVTAQVAYVTRWMDSEGAKMVARIETLKASNTKMETTFAE